MGAGVRRDVLIGRGAAVDLLVGHRPTPVTRVLADNGPDAWTAFDEEVRRIGRRSYEPLRGKRIEARLCDPDGRVRRSALRSWQHPPLDFFLLSFVDWFPPLKERYRQALGRANARHAPLELVLIRCADWAPPVRGRARRVLAWIVARYPVEALIQITPLALRLGGREHGAWAVRQLEAALTGRYSLLAAWWRPGRPSTTWSWNSLTPAQRADILDRLSRGRDLPARRFATRLIVEAGGTGVRELARRAALQPDPVTARLWADAALRAMAADGSDGAAVDTLLGATDPMVRASGVSALRGAGRTFEAERYLADRSGLVRACARRAVSQAGGDPAGDYLALLTGPGPVSPYAVTGFSECAEHVDAPLLRGLLDHPSGTVRAAAVAGLRRLDDATDDALLLPLLDDPSASVTREASLSLLQVVERIDHRHLSERIDPIRHLHVRRAAFRLLRAMGGIHELRAAVTVSKDPDPFLRAKARAIVIGWDWRYTWNSGEAERTEVAELLARSEHVLPSYEMQRHRSRLGLTG
ncbi:hypothetical protein ACWGDE_21830 [Streptomyces sp. NPDC054956]